MPIFAGMMTLSPHISEQFSGIIFRIEIDELSDTIFVEIRDHDEKKVNFGSIDLSSGQINFKVLTTPERWLTGIEAAYNGVLLLHYYQTETGPTHKGLMAVDAISGETLWSNFNYTFDHLSAGGPVIYDSRLQPRKLFLTDIKTGATIGGYEPSVYKALENSIVMPQILQAALLPTEILPLTPYGNMVHYLDYNNYRIVSLHALKAGQLIQMLYIYTEAGLIYEDLLNADIQKIQPEAFILHKKHLIYITNRTGLKVLTL
jgi:hypothetical protein